MKILIWTASFPPVLGGLQTVTFQLAEGLANKGHEVLVLTKRSKGLKEIQYYDKVKVHRIPHHNIVFTPKTFKEKISSIKNKMGYPFSKKKILDIILAFKPDVINIHFPDPQLAYWSELKEIWNGKLIISVHGHDILRWYHEEDGFITTPSLSQTEENPTAYKKLIELFEASSAITACSKWMLNKTIELIPQIDIPVRQHIHNAVDLSRFNVPGSKIEEFPYLFSFGRLAAHKGFDLLINAFHQIHEDFPKLKLLIGGSGSFKKNLETQIAQLELKDKVILLGRLDSEKIVTYSKGSQVVVIPSKREPFGISALEALASMRPVVCTDIGGIPEAVGKHALLVQADEHGIAKGIKNLLVKAPPDNNPELKSHLKHFTLKRFIDEYEKILSLNPAV